MVMKFVKLNFEPYQKSETEKYPQLHAIRNKIRNSCIPWTATDSTQISDFQLSWTKIVSLL